MTLPKRRHAPPVEPVTPEQWQEAVDAASFALAVDAAMQYGLVTGPAIDVDRCVDLLERGKALGYQPRPLAELLR